LHIDAYLADGTRPRELRAHCLTFCAALSRHHAGEDSSAFPGVAEQFPELRPELNSLAALMETHFLYEEKRIVAALNALSAPGWGLSQPDFLRTDDTERR
jgi:hypothetical protein